MRASRSGKLTPSFFKPGNRGNDYMAIYGYRDSTTNLLTEQDREGRQPGRQNTNTGLTVQSQTI